MILWLLSAAGAAPVQATAAADHDAVGPGASLRVAVHLEIPLGTRVFWVDEASVTVTAPEGFSTGAPHHPAPERLFAEASETRWGYRGETVVIVPMIAPTTGGDDARLGIEARWVACEEACRPASWRGELVLPWSAHPAPANQELFARWEARPARPSAPFGDVTSLDRATSVHLRFAAGSVEGDLDLDLLDRAIDGLLDPVRACARQHPGLALPVVSTLTIGRDGAVEEVSTQGEPAGLAACVNALVHTTTFPTGGRSAVGQLTVSPTR